MNEAIAVYQSLTKQETLIKHKNQWYESTMNNVILTTRHRSDSKSTSEIYTTIHQTKIRLIFLLKCIDNYILKIFWMSTSHNTANWYTLVYLLDQKRSISKKLKIRKFQKQNYMNKYRNILVQLLYLTFVNICWDKFLLRFHISVIHL